MQRTRFAFLSAALVLLCSARARADVDPAQVSLTLARGKSAVIPTTVTLPDNPPKLDVLLLIDVSASYFDDLPNVKALAPSLLAEVRKRVPDSRFALATFSDFPFEPWGTPFAGDYAYRLEQDLTHDDVAWLSAVNGLTLREGGDGPESQYEALFQAVTGTGLEMPVRVFQDGDYADLGEIEPGQQASFRPDAVRVIAIMTDTAFHDAGDDCPFCEFEYPGASRDDAVLALQEAGIKVIAVKAPGATAQMDDLADATGGSVVTTSDTSAEIADAITSGIEQLTYTVTARPRPDCSPLLIGFSPDRYDVVSAGEPLAFDVKVTVPASFPKSQSPKSATCVVDYLADDFVIGSQRIDVTIPGEGKPTCKKSCGCGSKRRYERRHGARHRRW